MRRVEERLRELHRLIGRCEAAPGDLRWKADLEADLRQTGAFWLPEKTAVRVRRLHLQLEPEEVPVGRALGVVAEPGVNQAYLVRIEVSWIARGNGDLVPLPRSLSAETGSSLQWGAWVASRLYPVAASLQPAADLHFRVLTLDGEDISPSSPITGQSFALAAVVATWSLLSGRSVWNEGPAPLFTGAIGSAEWSDDTPVVEVSGIDAKWAEVQQTGLHFFFPAAVAQRLAVASQLHPVARVTEVLEQVFGSDWRAANRCPLPPRADPAVTFELLDLEYRRSNWAHYEALAARFQEMLRLKLPVSLEAWARARAGACYTHLEKLSLAEPLLQEAISLVDRAGSEGSIDGTVEVLVRTHWAVLLRDRYRLEEARAQAERAWLLGDQLRVRRDAINARSTLGQVLVALGRHEEAIPHLTAARDFYEASNSEECPRNHTYLVEAHGRSGDLEAADHEHDVGIKHNEARARSTAVRGNRAYLDYALLSARLRWGRRNAGADWASLAKAADEAARGITGSWPLAGLRRIGWAAELRTADTPEARSRVAEAARVAADTASSEPLVRWHTNMVLLEASLVEPDHGRAAVLASEATEAIDPTWRPLRLLAEQVRGSTGPAFREAVLRLLEAEQY